MPQAIPIIAAAAATAAGAATTGVLGATAFTVLGLSVTYGAIAAVGITVAGAFLTAAMAQRPASPRLSAERQLTTNQSATHRFRCFGRVKVGGALALYDATDDNRLVQVVAHGEGPHHAVVQHHLDGEPVTLDAEGWVTAPAKWAGKVRVLTRAGAPDQVALPELVSAFDYWTAAHRLRGIAYTAVFQSAVRARDMAKVYPSGVLSYAQTLDGANDIYDPRDGSTGWSDNAALLVAWRLTSADGHALPSDAINWSSFAAYADYCDEPIALKAGGTEKRYRAAGRFSYETAPSEVVRGLLAVCDGDLYIDDDGRVAIRGGETVPANSACFEARHVLAMTLRGRVGTLDRYNAVRAVYLDPARDWQPTPAPEVKDAAAIAASGVKRVFELEIGFCPSGTQAQRLAKIMLGKLNPAYQGRIVTNLAGLAARQRGLCRLAWAGAPTDAPMMVTRAEIDTGALTTALEVQTIDPAAWAWDPANDEQDLPPPVALGEQGRILAAPTGVVFAPVSIQIDAATTGLAIRGLYTDPEDETLSAEMEISPAGLEQWRSFATETAHGVITSDPVALGGSYDARVRFIGPGGGPTAWVTQEDISAASPLPPPPAPTGSWTSPQSVGPVSGTVTIPDAPDLWRLRVWRGETTFAAATELTPRYGVRPGEVTITETLTAGTWRYWTALENTGAVLSAIDGPREVITQV